MIKLADINDKFRPNPEDALSSTKAVFKGKKYRITVLSEILLRLEYDESGQFEDRPTELARFRNFELPKFEKQENQSVLILTTEYFRLQYF